MGAGGVTRWAAAAVVVAAADGVVDTPTSERQQDDFNIHKAPRASLMIWALSDTLAIVSMAGILRVGAIFDLHLNDINR